MGLIYSRIWTNNSNNNLLTLKLGLNLHSKLRINKLLILELGLKPSSDHQYGKVWKVLNSNNFSIVSEARNVHITFVEKSQLNENQFSKTIYPLSD